MVPSAQDQVDEGVDVGDVDFAIGVDVGSRDDVAVEDHVDDGVHIGNCHFAVKVHVTINIQVGGRSRTKSQKSRELDTFCDQGSVQIGRSARK